MMHLVKEQKGETSKHLISNVDRNTRRIEGKVGRLELKLAIKAFDAYSALQMPGLNPPFRSNFRALLDWIPLKFLGSAESIVKTALQVGMEEDMWNEEIIQLIEDRVAWLADGIGLKVPGNHKALRPAPLLAIAQ